MKQKLILLFSLLCSLCFLFSCSSDDDDSTVVTIQVSDKTKIYQGVGTPLEGMLIREEGTTRWQCVPFGIIVGFNYEKGKAYIVKAIKVKVDPPLEDVPSWYYRLISQKVVEDTSNW